MSPLFAFMMPGPTEMIVIGVIAVLLFGRKLPKLAFDLGSSFTQFKKGVTMPMEELGECKDALTGGVNDLNKTVRDEHRAVKQAVENA